MSHFSILLSLLRIFQIPTCFGDFVSGLDFTDVLSLTLLTVVCALQWPMPYNILILWRK